jgi:hypothetical protein
MKFFFSIWSSLSLRSLVSPIANLLSGMYMNSGFQLAEAQDPASASVWQCYMSLLVLHATRSCSISVLHVRATCLCCISILYVRAAFPCQCCMSCQRCILGIHMNLHLFFQLSKYTDRWTMRNFQIVKKTFFVLFLSFLLGFLFWQNQPSSSSIKCVKAEEAA